MEQTGDVEVQLKDPYAREVSVIKKNIRRRLAAAALSALLPGLGQFILGAKRRGAMFGFVAVAYVVVFLALRVPGRYFVFAASVWLLLGLCSWSACDALRLHSPHSPIASPWWLLITVPVVLLGLAVYTNILVRAAGFGVFNVPSTSMEGTIMEGDRLIADLKAYRTVSPRPGDVVLFRHETLIKVKRVIAIGSSTVKGRAKVIFVDGKPLDESYVTFQVPGDPGIPELVNFGPVQVPTGEMFVAGDKRDVSLDSRTFGPIQMSAAIGKALYVVRPFSRGGISIR